MNQLEACQKAKRKWKQDLFKKSGVVSVGVGYKQVAGRQSDQIAVVVGVRAKKPRALLKEEDVIPAALEAEGFGAVPTDVIETGEVKALVGVAGEVGALALTSRVRPAPAGVSCGHIRITAGTLGLWVKKGSAPEWYLMSNNHVIANSNNAAPGDAILQPGPADGGRDPDDRIATLADYVRIRFEGENGGGGACLSAKWLVAAYNGVTRAIGCPVRLGIRTIEQPHPNLVDAAYGRAVSADIVRPEILNFGYPSGTRDAELGLEVGKTGRTTETTFGVVSQVNATVSVSYGDGKVAQFAEQFAIQASGFSAGGDSGSLIVTRDGTAAVGLLFAGGTGITFCNKISHVLSLLGVRLATPDERGL